MVAMVLENMLIGGKVTLVGLMLELEILIVQLER